MFLWEVFEYWEKNTSQQKGASWYEAQNLQKEPFGAAVLPLRRIPSAQGG